MSMISFSACLKYTSSPTPSPFWVLPLPPSHLLLYLALASASPTHLSSLPAVTVSTASTSTASSAAASTASTSAAAYTTTISAAATTTTTTSATSPAATPTPSAATAATATATSSSTRTLAPLALAGATSPTRGRRRAGRLETKQVGSSSRGNRGHDYASLCCEEGLLEEVDSESGGTDCEKVVPDDAKGVREANNYVVESDVHGGWVLSAELSRKGGAVASVTSAEVRNEWHDTLRTTLAALGFAPSTADSSLFLRTDTTLPPFYVLVYVDDLVFATADTEALAHVKSELQKRHTCTDLGELTSYLGLRITRDRAQCTITLTQSHMVQQVLRRFSFTYSSPLSTPLPTGHSLSAPPSDESVEPSGPYPELVGCLIHRKEHMDAAKRVLRYLCSTSGMALVLGGRARVVLTGHADASWSDDLTTQWSSQGYTFSLGPGSVSWRSTRSSSVLSSSCEAEIYTWAMAAQELRLLTYLLTDLGEPPRSPPVLYVDNKAMLALCQEHRLEHRTKHIALRYFLARELQQLYQLRLAYVASRANTADVFTKALQPCDHQRFCTVLGLVPTVPHLLTS
ncbi:unnamed protein product [Closterium sp. NIES-53]